MSTSLHLCVPGTYVLVMTLLTHLSVASNEVRTAWSGLAAIDGYLGNKEKDATLMKPHVDQFLIAVSLQLRMAYTKHMTGNKKILHAFCNVDVVETLLFNQVFSIFVSLLFSVCSI